MRRFLRLAPIVVVPAIAPLMTDAVARAQTSAPITVASARPASRPPATLALRAGITVPASAAPALHSDSDTARRSPASRRVVHAAIGAGIGLAAGAGAGAAAGAIIDSRGTGEAMIPAAGILAVEGAAVGLLVGTIVGALAR